MKINKTNIGISLFAILFCSFATSMTPTEVNETLPSYTKSFFYNQTKASEAIESNKCKMLVKGRAYVASIRFIAKDD